MRFLIPTLFILFSTLLSSAAATPSSSNLLVVPGLSWTVLTNMRMPNCLSNDLSPNATDIDTLYSTYKGEEATKRYTQTTRDSAGWHGCTMILEHGEAEVYICGAYGASFVGSIVVDMIRVLNTYCKKDGKVEGFFQNYTKKLVISRKY